MIKKTSRLLSIFLCCVMLLGLLPVTASAASVDTIAFSIPMRKTVETMTGATVVEGTYDFFMDYIDNVSISIHPTTTSVTTDTTAAWTLTGEIVKDQVNLENGWWGRSDGTYDQVFTLYEEVGTVPGCRYSQQAYNVVITVNKETGKADVKLYIYGEDTLVQEANFINTFEPEGYFAIPVEKTVKRIGTEDPGQEGFIFKLEDFDGNDPEDYGINLTCNLITTTGTGTFTGELAGTIADPEKFMQRSSVTALSNTTYRSTFVLSELDTGYDGWTYDTGRYAVDILYNSQTGLVTTETHVVGNDVYVTASFTNTYSKPPELNKTDHFAFLNGYPDGTFGPNKKMTRAEVTVMFARLLTEQMDPDKTYTNTFADVPASAWYANYIGYMQRFGIINGYEDGTFRPNASITRAEFATIACRFEKLTEGSAAFSDVSKSHWAYKYINFAATRGWVNGYPDGTFRPGNNITRAEVASVTCRLLERNADRAYVESHYDTLPRVFTDIDSSHWAYWYVMEAANGHDYTKSGSAETWTNTYE